MRIVGGAARGRRLAAPRHGTRPTADAVREALFTVLTTRWAAMEGLRVLDLYAGSGALGLEAVSRGASRLVAVESDRTAAAVLRQNVAAVAGRAAEVRVRVQPVRAFLAAGPRAREVFDLVLADPPYADAEAEAAVVLPSLMRRGWLAPEAAVVWEQSSRAAAPTWPAGLGPWPIRRHGEAALHLAVLDDDAVTGSG